MTSLIYTQQKSKLSKKQRAAREQLLKEQRAIKKDLKASRSAPRPSFVNPVAAPRSTAHVPSLGSGLGSATLKPKQEYTGDQVLGIAILHKSCLQPVFSQQEAVDAASMRR